jgi:hypothetical protein
MRPKCGRLGPEEDVVGSAWRAARGRFEHAGQVTLGSVRNIRRDTYSLHTRGNPGVGPGFLPRQVAHGRLWNV